MSKLYSVKRTYKDGRKYETKLYRSKSGVKSAIRYDKWRLEDPDTTVEVLEYDVIPNRTVPVEQFMSEKNPIEMFMLFNVDDNSENQYYVIKNAVEDLEKAKEHFSKYYGVDRDKVRWIKRNALNL